LQRAIYSVLTFPSLNPADSSLAVLFDSPRIINPEVSLSKGLTANREDKDSVQHKQSVQPREHTVYLFVTKLVLEDLYEGMPKISSRCVNWLQGQVKHRIHCQGTTHYTPRLANDNKFPFSVVMNDFHRFSGDGGFIPMHHIPGTGLSLGRCCDNVRTPNSIRSPFWIMVSGLAISPLMVVTPDSRAYLWMET
jgi:hypothetical protein